jgi:hypothetical protein
MQRHTLGILAAMLLVAGIVLGVGPWKQETVELVQAAGLRVGLLLGAGWLAYDDLSRLPPWLLPLWIGMIVVVAWRPRLFPLALVVGAALLLLQPRRPGSRHRDESP